ncbi:hypothetical protein SAMN02745704_00972 [Paucidesulfovibrio gracilis DSM 16080]|uniref:Uncharacterized protein n=1 Tax=Paucidesulfovibrio gracilis DSM 16080 TaxID=1121449 RepID=A0A1T4WJ52_9BACT|nr:hypothetical protein [Paucidesulfovibrio gracilis]SKA77342.1 hypothetical protein SAMN02745704_00972 [Paucidesulfovibrio gracilis DSM 16080]
MRHAGLFGWKRVVFVLGIFIGMLFPTTAGAVWGEEGGIPLFSGEPGKTWLPVEERTGQFASFVSLEDGALLLNVPEGHEQARIGITSRRHVLLVPPEGQETGIDFTFDPEITSGLRIVASNGPLDLPDVGTVVFWWATGGGIMGFMTDLEQPQDSKTNTGGWKPGTFTLYVASGLLTLQSANGAVMEVPTGWAVPGTQVYLTVTGNASPPNKATSMGLSQVRILPPPPDPSVIQAELEKVLDEFDLRGEALLPFVDVPAVDPVGGAEEDDRVQQGEAGIGAGIQEVLQDVPNFFISEAVADEGCGTSIDEFISKQRRIEATLGKTSDIGGAMKNLFWDMVGKSKFPEGFMETVRKNLDLAGAAWDYGKAGYEGYQAGDPSKMALAMTQMTLKVMLDSCKTEADFRNFSKFSRGMLAASLKKMSKAQRKAVLAQLSHALKRQITYAEILAKGLDYNPGTGAGQAVGGSYKEALFTVTSSAVIAFVPQLAIAKSAAALAWEGIKATRDWVVDDNVQTLYAAYREEIGGGGAGARAMYDMRTMHDGPTMMRTRSLMRSLGMGRDKDGNEIPITNAEAEKFIEAKFKKWYAMEQKGAERADRYATMRDDYLSLDPSCKNGLRDRLWPKGLYGAGYQFNTFRDACHYEKIMFEEYAKLRGKIRANLETWRAKSGKGQCPSDQLDWESGRLTCRLLSGGEEAYRRLFVKALDECNLLEQPRELMQDKYRKRVEERFTGMRSSNAVALLQHMGRTDLLRCLCGRYSIMGSGCSYRPEKVEGCPSRGGPCVQGNWGCSRKPLPTDEAAMRSCRIAEKLAEDAVAKRLVDVP